MIDEALIEVRDLLEAGMVDIVDSVPVPKCKKYYAGDTGVPANSALPCIIVRERYTEVERSSTSSDMFRFGISILLITDLRKSLKEGGLTDEIVASRQLLRKMVEEIDSSTGRLKTNTLLGVLLKQSNLRGTNFQYNLKPRVNYAVPSPKNWNLVAAEVTLDVISRFVTRNQ